MRIFEKLYSPFSIRGLQSGAGGIFVTISTGAILAVMVLLNQKFRQDFSNNSQVLIKADLQQENFDAINLVKAQYYTLNNDERPAELNTQEGLEVKVFDQRKLTSRQLNNAFINMPNTVRYGEKKVRVSAFFSGALFAYNQFEGVKRVTRVRSRVVESILTCEESANCPTVDPPNPGDGPNRGPEMGVPVPTPGICDGVSQVFSFPGSMRFPRQKGCDFGSNGNLTSLDLGLRARREEYQSVSIPPGSTLCHLSFQSLRSNQKFDDDLLITLNKRVLVTTRKQITDNLDKNGGLPIWNWPNVRGIDWPEDNISKRTRKSICFIDSCVVPHTETTGTLSLSLEKISIDRFLNRGSNVIEFGLITTGDNNNSDCSHRDMVVNFEVFYTK